MSTYFRQPSFIELCASGVVSAPTGSQRHNHGEEALWPLDSRKHEKHGRKGFADDGIQDGLERRRTVYKPFFWS